MAKVWKIVVTILILGAVTFACLFAAVVLIFSGEGEYLAVLGIIYAALLFLIPATIAGYFSRRLTSRLWLSLLGVLALAITIKESVRGYHNSFEKFPERGVDLSLYQPFRQGSLAVTLDETPTLTLSDSLPRMDGATAFYPMYAAFAQALYPPGEYPLYEGAVVCTSTPYAYSALVRGDADIIFVLGPSENQIDDAIHREVEMEFTPIGYEAFVFFVNSRNPVSGLTSEQLRSIYSGETTNWKELGGRNKKIRAFQRETDSGSQTAFLDFMEGNMVMRPPLNDVVHGMGPIIDRTANYANYPNAIGFTFRHFAEGMVANDGIKLLSVDGVYPSNESIESGEYPLRSTFYAVTRAGETNPNVGRLLEWILSPQGQEIIRLTGYNPVR